MMVVELYLKAGMDVACYQGCAKFMLTSIRVTVLSAHQIVQPRNKQGRSLL